MKKEIWLNNAKALGIILVVFAHAIVQQIQKENAVLSTIRQIIYIFHMPYFFVLSGFLYEMNIAKYKKIGIKAFIYKKFCRLMLPYVSVSVVVYFVYFTLEKMSLFKSFTNSSPVSTKGMSRVLLEILTISNHIDSHMWFLYALFIVFIVQYLSSNFWITPLGIALQIVFILLITMLPLPELFIRVLTHMVYFTIGRIMSRQKKNIKTTANTEFVYLAEALILVLLSLYLWSGKTGIESYFFILKFLRRTINFIAAVRIITILINILMRNELKLNSIILNKIGENEYGIYLFHQPFIVSGTVTMLCKIINGGIRSWFYVLMGTVLGLAVPIVITYILNKNDILKFLFLGEKRRLSNQK